MAIQFLVPVTGFIAKHGFKTMAIQGGKMIAKQATVTAVAEGGKKIGNATVKQSSKAVNKLSQKAQDKLKTTGGKVVKGGRVVKTYNTP
ncbi:MAG: hypothetical protein FWF23_03320 [Alphaproteobacteria bacterium]|nr:hypothetical protein [Alphaproteobacteria bacterium]MCL2505663.1 hypothetical protein [Alphaproteobacteria bacterium]